MKKVLRKKPKKTTSKALKQIIVLAKKNPLSNLESLFLTKIDKKMFPIFL